MALVQHGVGANVQRTARGVRSGDTPSLVLFDPIVFRLARLLSKMAIRKPGRGGGSAGPGSTDAHQFYSASADGTARKPLRHRKPQSHAAEHSLPSRLASLERAEYMPVTSAAPLGVGSVHKDPPAQYERLVIADVAAARTSVARPAVVVESGGWDPYLQEEDDVLNSPASLCDSTDSLPIPSPPHTTFS